MRKLMQSLKIGIVVSITRIEKRKVQIGSARYQYEMPLLSSQRSWKAQMRPADRHTPSDAIMSPMTCAIAALIARLFSSSSSR